MAMYTAVALLCSLLVLSAKCDGVVEQPGPFDSSIVTSADQPATPDDPNKLIPFDELSPELKIQVGKLISKQLKEEQEKKLAEQKNSEIPVLTAVQQGDSYILNTDSLPKEVKEDVLRQLVQLAANTEPIKKEGPSERLATEMADYLTRTSEGQLNVDQPVDFDDLPEGLRRELDNYLGNKQESDKIYGQNDLVEKNKQGETAAVLGGEFLGGLLGGALGGGYPGGYYPGGNRPGGYPGGYPGSYPGSYPGGYPGGYPGSYPGGGYPGGGYPGSYPGSGYPGGGYPGGQYGGYRPSGSYPAAYQQPASSSSYNTGKFRQQYYASPYQAFYASPYQSYSAQPYVSSVAGYYPYSSPVSSYYQPMSYGYRKQSMPYHQPGAYSVAPGQSLRIIPSGSALSYQPKEILPKTGFNPVYYLVPQRKL